MAIVFNGVSYQTPADMPPDVRRQYDAVMAALADRDGDGIPDIARQGGSIPATVVTTTSIQVNGQSVSSLDDLPPTARAAYDEAQRLLRDLGPGAPPGVTVRTGAVPGRIAAGGTVRGGTRHPASMPAPTGGGRRLASLLVLFLALAALALLLIP